MKGVFFIFLALSMCMQANHAAGVLTSVYLNPVGGDDERDGSLVYPVRTWDRALSLAADDATIYISLGAVLITSDMTIDGSQYGATNITVTPYTGYTGALFAIADNATGTFSNLTLKGVGTAQSLLSVNSGGTLEIRNDVGLTGEGRIALDRGARPINLMVTPPAGMNYPLLTTYTVAADEGRALVNAGGVASPLLYFTLIEPASNDNVDFEIALDGTIIRLYELPKGGIYLDPVNGNDSYSGARSNRPIKTLAVAIEKWDSRNTASPGIVTDIYVLSRIILTENLTLDNDIRITRFAGDADRSITMTDILIDYTGFDLTINHATIQNGTIAGIGLYSESNGNLTLNDGATINSAKNNHIIQSENYGTIILNEGSTILNTATNPGSDTYCLRSNSSTDYTINGGTITSTANVIYKNGGNLLINGGVITHTGSNYCFIIYNGTAVINHCDITSSASTVIYNYSNITMHDGIIRNVNMSSSVTYTIYSGSRFTMNGGTIEGGLSTAVYNATSTAGAIILNGGHFSSTNTENGTVFSGYSLTMNGQNVIIDGILKMSNTNVESYNIIINTPAVTQNYTIQIADGANYAALIKSNPAIDLGPYLDRFTLEPKSGYALTAYANKGETNRSIVLYDPNGIYVNDYTGDDSNSGASPDAPVKTLENAAHKTTPDRTSIYICDSTLTINSVQTITPSAPKDTIKSFMFRASAYLMRITNTGVLTLQNIAVFAPTNYVSRNIVVDNGELQLNTGAVIFSYSTSSNTRYSIYQSGGNVVMNSGSKISGHPTTTTNYGYGIYVTGNAAKLTIADDAIIERQYNTSLYILGGATVTIGAAIIQNNYSSGNYAAIYVTNGKVELNRTIIQNSSYRALRISGVNTVVNMTDGIISNNGGGNISYQGAVIVENQGVFNFSGGTIEKYRAGSASAYVQGELVYLTSGGKMNFYGGTLTVSDAAINAIYVHASNITATTSGRLSLSNQAMLDSGYIYCSSPYFAPIHLIEPLDPDKNFQVNFGDNMSGCVLVDGTSANTFPASVGNFTLNPQISTLSLQQSGDNVIVNSSAIYLNGSNGNDNNDGSSAALAVRTFTRARERLMDVGGNEIIVIGAATLNNDNESTEWDLSFNPDAIIRRGLGYTGYLVEIRTGKSLTLSDITFDGNKEFVTGSVSAIIVNDQGTLTMNSGTVIRNNNSYGIYNLGNFYMNGGEISYNNTYGVSLSGSAYTTALREFIMTGGSIRNNGSYGINAISFISMRLLGGEIVQNRTHGVYNNPFHASGVIEIGGTMRIAENGSSGITYYSSSDLLDSLIISGGEISNNGSQGANVYVANTVITGGEISGNGTYGLYISYPGNRPNSSCTVTGLTVKNNSGSITTGYGLRIAGIQNVSIADSHFSGNGSSGIEVASPSSPVKSVLSITGVRSDSNRYGLDVSAFETMSIENVEVSNNNGYGIRVVNNASALPGTLAMKDITVDANNGFGVTLTDYITTSLSGQTRITNNKNTGFFYSSYQISSISGDVLIKGNNPGTSNSSNLSNAGGIHAARGKLNISGDVTLEADSAYNYAGGIYVAAAAEVVITGNMHIRDCVNMSGNTTISYGGAAIFALGKLSMTGGRITGCQTPNARGTVHVSGANSQVNLTNVTIRDNIANYGGAIYVNTQGKITLDSDTVTNNISKTLPNATTPLTGAIHLAGGANGRLSLRDKNLIENEIYIASQADTIYIDEALLFSDVGAIRLLGYVTNSVTTSVTTPGNVVVSPNGTTVTDASQFLTRFTLMNTNGRGLDKGGTDDKHIMIVYQFFIDGTKPDNGSGSNPDIAFNSLTQAKFIEALQSDYTTVWVSGPVKTVGTQSLPLITKNGVNIRRYTGFAVTAQLYPAYDSVMITIEPGTSLTIPGGNSAVNTFTVSGEGGSPLSDASIFKNYGTLTIGGYTNLYFNPTGGNGAAVNQNGVFNLSGNVDFNLYSPNTVYLAEDKVINIVGPLHTKTPIGVTVETTPVNTHKSARVVVTGAAANVPAGMVNLFYNEITPDPLPIGRFTDGADAELMFYIADRNVAGIPIYTKLQDAFEAAVVANNDEVRLYGNTPETVFVNKRLRYKSNGYAVQGSFTLDSMAQMQLSDDLKADTLHIHATTFSNKAQLDMNSHRATIAEAAYLDLRLPSDAAIGDWYPVNLPFDARIADVRDASDTLRQVLHLQDYGIAAFDGQRRANYGVGNQPSNPYNDWQFFTEPVMTNGKGYMVTADGIETLRFKAANLNLFATVASPAAYSVGPAGNIHYGINYLAQPLPSNAVITGGIPDGAIVQVSENLSSDRIGAASYVAKRVDPSLVIAPYTNYFYQTDANSVVTYTQTTLAATVRNQTSSDNAEWRMPGQTSSDNAEWRMQNAEWGQTSSDNGTGDLRLRGNDMVGAEKNDSAFSILHSAFKNDSAFSILHSAFKNDSAFSILHSAFKKVENPLFYEFRLSEDVGTKYDALFVAASEYASKERYEIGRDVVKMGTIGHTAQIWSVDFDVPLCANEVLMKNGSATIPLFIHTPVAGRKYRLSLQNAVSGSEQLWLYRAGKPVQDLIRHPEYSIEGIGGTTEEYSLQIRSNTTFNDPVEKSEVYVYAESNAIIINGLQLNDRYFVYDLSGRLFATGTATDSLARIYIAKGTYIVQINGISHKVIVIN